MNQRYDRDARNKDLRTQLNGPDTCNYAYCAVDESADGRLAIDACREQCGNLVTKPEPKHTALPKCPSSGEDDSTFFSGYGDCASYDASLCDNDSACNHQYCVSDMASEPCPFACESCNGCGELPIETCNNRCDDTEGIVCKGIIVDGEPIGGSPDAECFCDQGCEDRGDCCPGRSLYCQVRQRDVQRDVDDSRMRGSRHERSVRSGRRGLRWLTSLLQKSP